MKETNKSLKYLFIIFGVFGLFSIGGISIISQYPILGIIDLINVIFGIVYIYIGVKLYDLMPDKNKYIINFLWIDLIFAILTNVYLLLIMGGVGYTIFNIAINVVITLYLINNINKLAENRVIDKTNKN